MQQILKRKRIYESDSSEDTFKNFCAFSNVNGEPCWNHNTQGYHVLMALIKPKGHKYYDQKKRFNSPKKLNALVEIQVKKVLKSSREKPKNKKNDPHSFSRPDIDSSDGEEEEVMTLDTNHRGSHSWTTTTTVASFKDPIGVPPKLYVLLDTGYNNAILSERYSLDLNDIYKQMEKDNS